MRGSPHVRACGVLQAGRHGVQLQLAQRRCAPCRQAVAACCALANLVLPRPSTLQVARRTAASPQQHFMSFRVALLLQLVCGTLLPLVQHFQFDARRRRHFRTLHYQEQRRQNQEQPPPQQREQQPQQERLEGQVQQVVAQAPGAAQLRQRRSDQ